MVSTGRKLVLLASAWTQARFIHMPAQTAPPLAAIAPMVEGCSAQAQTQQRSSPGWFPNRAMPQRVEWMFDLLERREHERLRRRRHS